jgi:hypothetical protein
LWHINYEISKRVATGEKHFVFTTGISYFSGMKKWLSGLPLLCVTAVTTAQLNWRADTTHGRLPPGIWKLT